MRDDLTIPLWIFPAEDFPDWRELVGSPQVATYGEYLTLIAAVQADQERQGRTVVRLDMTVATMRERLKSTGLANTPDNRAAVLGLEAAKG